MALGPPAAIHPLGQGPQPPTGLPDIGGSGSWALRWLRDNPSYRFALHPSLIPTDSGKPIGTIRLWHENDRRPAITSQSIPDEPVPEGFLEVWVSQDNATYLKYDGPMTLTQGVRQRRPPVFAPAPQQAWDAEGDFFCIELSDLDITEPFVCVVPREPMALANTLAALVEVQDQAGEPVVTTFGVAPAQPYGEAGHDWRSKGIAFDTARLTQLPGRALKYSAGRARFCWTDLLTSSPNRQKAPGAKANQPEHVLLGLARGRREWLPQPLDLSHVPARQWLCSLIENALDTGVDAVDIRTGSHVETLDWENYGFGAPAMAEFRRRYGVDPACELFDRQAWLALRGQYMDTFMAEASQLVHRYHKPLYAHVVQVMDPPADWPAGTAMNNQLWSWRQWLADGLVDGLTLKNIKPDAPMFHDAAGLCQQRNRPVFLNTKPAGGSTREASWIEQANQAQAADVDHLNLYESANLSRLQADGSIQFLYPQLWDHVAASNPTR